MNHILSRTLLFTLFTCAALSGCGREDLPNSIVPALQPEQAESTNEEQAVDAKLFDVWEKETTGVDAAAVDALNENTLSSLEHRSPVAGAQPFGPQEASEAHLALETNLVTINRTKYEQPGTSIGYCFGRAMFVHLYSLKHHYRKGQIRKVWAIGHMKTGTHDWAFHVATMLQDGVTGQWLIVDSFTTKPVPPRDWFKIFVAQNQHRKDLRIYVTAPEKFTPNLGKYNRTQLGLDLERNKDWYKHYFTDMMETLKVREELDRGAFN